MSLNITSLLKQGICFSWASSSRLIWNRLQQSLVNSVQKRSKDLPCSLKQKWPSVETLRQTLNILLNIKKKASFCESLCFSCLQLISADEMLLITSNSVNESRRIINNVMCKDCDNLLEKTCFQKQKGTKRASVLPFQTLPKRLFILNFSQCY